MPEAGHHHVLDGASFAVRQLHLDSLAGRFGLGNWPRGTGYSGAVRFLFWLRLDRLAVPLRIVEMVVSFHKIVDREVVLSVIEAGATADDLLEFDHGMNRAH